MSWRRQQGEGGNHSGYILNSGTNPWRDHSVPYWEKQFCMWAGLVPWGKLVETKKYMPSLYKNIVQWNDSAGEEAFNHAKSRFWAELNGLPCNISLPDPDAYIDDVDWSSSNIDPEVILDLERSREPKPYYDDHGQTLDPEAVVIIGLHHTVSNQTVPCTGWGDAEEDLKTKENVHENPWEPACCHQSKAAAMGGGWGSNTRNKWKNNYSRKTNYYGRGDNGVSWGNFKSDVNGGSWCQNQSRHKISRFVGSDRNKWKNNYSWKTNYDGRGDHGVSWGNFKSDVNGGSWCQNQSRYKISRFVDGDSYQKAGVSGRKEEQSSRW